MHVGELAAGVAYWTVGAVAWSDVAAAKKSLNPKDLKNAVKQAGHPAKSDATLYTQIFAMTKKDPAVVKTKAGYALKAGKG